MVTAAPGAVGSTLLVEDEAPLRARTLSAPQGDGRRSDTHGRDDHDGRPRDTQLLLQLLRPGDVALSPDGARIAFAVSASFREQGKPIETRLWVGDVGGELEQREAGSLPRFSPDGSRLAFASDRGHEGRLSLRVDDRELGEIPGSVEDIHWSPDGARLLVLAADLGADRAGADSATKIEEAGAEAQDPKVFRPAKFWRRLWLVDAATGDTRDVTPESVNVFELGWAGGKVAAVCSDEPSESAWYDAWLGLIDLEGRSVERVHTPKWQLQAPRISPGGRVAFVEGFSSDRGTLTGTVHVLGVGPIAPELDATWIDFADEETLWVAGWRGAGSFAGRLSLDGSFEELAGGDVTLGTQYSPRSPPAQTAHASPRCWRAPTSRPRSCSGRTAKRLPVTSLNAEVAPGSRRSTGAPTAGSRPTGSRSKASSRCRATAANGPLPLVVLVHGGPTGCWSWMFAPAYGLSQIFAAAGYATLLPNVRGSVGAGRSSQRRTSATWAAAISRTSSPASTRSCATGSSTTRASRSPVAATAASCPPGRSPRPTASPLRSPSRS